jgi:PIN domain nuclease of toxin-antitoxin system
MSLLLDTHIFLWFISGDNRLPAFFRDAIRDPANDVFLSVASVWETIIKHQLGKLPLPAPAELYLPAQRKRHLIATLPIDEQSMLHLAALARLHADPFDRLLIAQSFQHNLTLVTVDQALQAYGARLLQIP